MVAAAKRAVSIPVLVKVSANWLNLVDVVASCLNAGPTAWTPSIPLARAAHRRGSGEPLLRSFAWYSGDGIRPVALRSGRDLPRPRRAGGGHGASAGPKMWWEMVMAGATAVGVHTAPLLEGLGWLARRWTGWTGGSQNAATST